jgi:hypothetical protein
VNFALQDNNMLNSKKDKPKSKKLYITDEGDPSEGILPQTYTVETPFSEVIAYADDDIEWFKKQTFAAYKDFSEGKLDLCYENKGSEKELNMKAKQTMTLYVYDTGNLDILPNRYVIKTPFPDGFTDKKALTWFKDTMYNLYDTCGVGKVYLFYDWELQEEDDAP